MEYVFSKIMDDAIDDWYADINNSTRYFIISTIAVEEGMEAETFGYFLVTKAVGYLCRELTAESMIDIFLKWIRRDDMPDDLTAYFQNDNNVVSFINNIEKEVKYWINNENN